MKAREDIQPITALKTRAASLVERVQTSRRPVVITQNGEASAILIDVESYEALRDATTMLKLIEQSETQIRKGETVTQKEAFARARARVRKA